MISDHLRVARFKRQSVLRLAIVRGRFEAGRAVVSGMGLRHMRGFVKRVDIRTICPNFTSQRVCMGTPASASRSVTALSRCNHVSIRPTGVCNVVCLNVMELTRSANGSNSRASPWTGTVNCLGICHVRQQPHCAQSRATDATDCRFLMAANITSGATALIRRNTPSDSSQNSE